MLEQLYSESTELKRQDEKSHNLAVDFAIRQILQDIENPEVLSIRISGRDGRVTSSAVNIRAVEENSAAHF